MIKKLLVLLGLAKAPTPVRTYLVASSAVGAVPAALFLAWTYRGTIAPMLRRATPQRSERLPAPAWGSTARVARRPVEARRSPSERK